MRVMWTYARWRCRHITVRSALIVVFFGLAQVLYVLPYLVITGNLGSAALSLVAIAVAMIVFCEPFIEARVVPRGKSRRLGPDPWIRSTPSRSVASGEMKDPST